MHCIEMQILMKVILALNSQPLTNKTRSIQNVFKIPSRYKIFNWEQQLN